ncbi:MAG: GGDEF domain-containing protein [Terracidiphilus sp.]
MKRLIPAFAVMLVCVSGAGSASPEPLTTLRQIRALPKSQASKKLPATFEATVTYYRDYEGNIFAQDGKFPVYINASPSNRFGLVPGDRILVKGSTRAGIFPYIEPSSVSLLRHGSLPKPLLASFKMLIGPEHDSALVVIHGVIRAVDLVFTGGRLSTEMQVVTDGGVIQVNIDTDSPPARDDLLDAEVEITGVASGTFDGKWQKTGVLIHVQSLAYLKILKRASTSPWSLPLTPMDQVIANYDVTNHTRRVRVHGTITYFQHGFPIVLQDDEKSIWMSTQTNDLYKVGEVVDATGFPEVRNGFLILTQGEIRGSQILAPVQPIPATLDELARNAHIFDLVSIEGILETADRGASQDEFNLIADGQPFKAVYHHPNGDALPPMRLISAGSKVRVTGICITEISSPYYGRVPFNILLRSFNDIEVIANPSPVNTRNLLIAVGLLLVLVFVMLVRGWALERKVRRQTAAMSARIEAEAELERQRSRILEDINGSRPLAEILEEIVAMVSSTLEGAPCWYKASDGTTLGTCRDANDGLRIVQAEIPARFGPPLGKLFAGVDPQTLPALREAEALQNGARLAALAIETRRLYSDLRRRSEFDLLTDVPNRFAMEKFIELKIEEASISGKILGLIYIDLDKFKPINDTYGHHVGDLYLQAVALRMSRQLLGGDMLARLGGDEFAALVSLPHGRADLEKIVSRLEDCFVEPFAVEGIVLHGEASIGVALYPEDGATKDSLLSAADTAMYDVKKSKSHATAENANIQTLIPSQYHLKYTANSL